MQTFKMPGVLICLLIVDFELFIPSQPAVNLVKILAEKAVLHRSRDLVLTAVTFCLEQCPAPRKRSQKSTP